MKFVYPIVILLIMLVSQCCLGQKKDLFIKHEIELSKVVESMKKINKNDLLLIATDGSIVKSEGLAPYMFSGRIGVGDEVCRGEGIPFAQCVKKIVEKGTCVTIVKDGEEFVGIEANCPQL